MPLPTLSQLLKRMVDMAGSDLHLTTNSPPRIRVHGELKPLDDIPPLGPAETKQLAYSILTDSQKHRFEENLELDFSFGIKNIARFRGNLFNQRGATAGVFRVIPFEIKSFDQLKLPPILRKLCEKPRGLILVTGPTGSGKSTTLATMLDSINESRYEHMLTIEDPIEFIHPHKRCLVNQREVHSDTHSFSNALRAALREDPDVVLIGEIRDLETAQIAVQASLTGHLVLSTLHTNTAAGAITRLRDMGIEPFLLSSSLIGVLAQRLVRVLNPATREMFHAGEFERRLLNLDPHGPPVELYRPSSEPGNGYRGRTGIYELIAVDDHMRTMIHDGSSEQELERYARTASPGIRDDGRRKVLAGETTLEEVLRVTRED